MASSAAYTTFKDSSKFQLSIGDQHIPVDMIEDTTTTRDVVERIKNAQIEEDDDSPFYAIDVGQITKMYDEWIRMLPNVTPFYAVKCNSDPVMLKVLAELGTGFDCASKQEIEKVLSLNVSPERIIFANPCKMISHLKYAAEHGVNKMTFDRESELYKVEKYFKDAELILRIKPDNPNDSYEFTSKLGCSVDDAVHLLEVSKGLHLNVIGVSFHLGSDGNSTVFESSIAHSQTVFEEAQRLGYNLSLLDIGGGFPGASESKNILNTLTDNIAQSLDNFLTAFPQTKVVSEPGQYFATSCHTLAVMIHSTMSLSDETQVYHVSDGSFNSFAVFAKHNIRPQLSTLKMDVLGKKFPSVIWGPTVAPDKVISTPLPKLDIGDWLYFKDMGAYTREFGCSSFNGFPRPKCYYFISHQHLGRIQGTTHYQDN